MSDLNIQLSRIFKDMSSIYEYLGGDQRFRSLAYQKVARVLYNLPEDISFYIKNNTLDDIPGVGESIAEKIKEYVATGSIKKYEELKDQVPHEILDMTEIKGFGPASLKAMHEKLHLNTREEIISALKDGSISKIKGFGKKKVENMIRGLKLHKTIEDRMLLWNALELGNKIVAGLKQVKEVLNIELAGSLRRKKETIGDIDILVSCKMNDRKKIITAFTMADYVKTILLKGNEKASILLKEHDRQVDLRIVNDNEWGAALLYFTGSKEHNVHLRTIAKERGYKINEYGVFRIKDNVHIAGKAEEEIYNLFGYQWIPPELREDKGELALAAKRKIPKLIELKDIKGDLQMHSDWSDGMFSVDKLAAYVQQHFNYEYIAITDHSKSERIAGGMNENRFLEQMKIIRDINSQLGKEFVKSGAEVDILNDGSLDLSNDLLDQLDWVCASIHSGFNKDNTERLISACENPFVYCIGHPTGRLIGKREPYNADWAKVFNKAAETGTAMEINAQPDRMDLRDELAKMAVEAGVKLVISTDSHTNYDFSLMQLGIFIAKRAGCTIENILNAKSWEEINQFKRQKKERMLV
jgi:DNA polymerase (family X)